MFERLRGANPYTAYLDFACGTGKILEVFKDLIQTKVGVDTSAGQLAAARNKVPDAKLVHGNLVEIPSCWAAERPGLYKVKNVVIRSGVIEDMGAVCDSVHAVVLPGLEHRSFIPCPRSGLAALAHGKPLLLPHLVSLAPSVSQSRAGVAFEPTRVGLKAAVLELQADYSAYQANTQHYIAENFSPATHLEMYRRLYQPFS